MGAVFIQDQRNAISLAQKQGQAAGREAGREAGALAMQKAIAMNLLATMDNAAIARLTGLSLEVVEGLRSGGKLWAVPTLRGIKC